MLSIGGNFYMSFKHGVNDYDKNARHFACYNEATIGDVLSKTLTNYTADIWVSSDVRKDRKRQSWTNVLLMKRAE